MNLFYDAVFGIDHLPIPSKRLWVKVDEASGTATVGMRQSAKVFEATIRYYFDVIKRVSKWPTPDPVFLAIEATLPPTEFGQKDVDNVSKSVLDALKGLIYEDDRQVVSLFVSKASGADHSLVVGVKRLVPGEKIWFVPPLREAGYPLPSSPVLPVP